jgi:hypothetical protein
MKERARTRERKREREIWNKRKREREKGGQREKYLNVFFPGILSVYSISKLN